MNIKTNNDLKTIIYSAYEELNATHVEINGVLTKWIVETIPDRMRVHKKYFTITVNDHMSHWIRLQIYIYIYRITSW